MIITGVIAAVASFRPLTPGKYSTKACDNGSKGYVNKAVPQSGTSTVPVSPCITRFDLKASFY